MDSLQNAKDTFYTALRDRLLALNPNRTVVVRGSTRPAVLAMENEIAAGFDQDPGNCFLLNWTLRSIDQMSVATLYNLRCEIRYSTSGSPEVAGMDRGRVLSAMDGELRQMLQPASVTQGNYATGTLSVGVSKVFWNSGVYETAKASGDRLSRKIAIDVFAWQEGT